MLRASKNHHPQIVGRLRIKVGQGITGWVAQHREPVFVPRNAAADPRFKLFSELPEDRFEAFLSVPLVSQGRWGASSIYRAAKHVCIVIVRLD